MARILDFPDGSHAHFAQCHKRGLISRNAANRTAF
jgi:hypothetical protein